MSGIPRINNDYFDVRTWTEFDLMMAAKELLRSRCAHDYHKPNPFQLEIDRRKAEGWTP